MAVKNSREIKNVSPVLHIKLSPIEEINELYPNINSIKNRPIYKKSRQEYNERLQEVERQINMVARGGGEPYITLENRVDFEKFPENFSYTCRNIPGPGVLIWPDPAYIVACDCKDRCNEKCSCPLHSGSEFAYDFSGRVTLARRRPIYECNMKCPCRSNCGNRVVQRGRQVRVSTVLYKSFFGLEVQLNLDVSKYKQIGKLELGNFDKTRLLWGKI